LFCLLESVILILAVLKNFNFFQAGIAMIGINEKLVFEVGKYKVKDAFGIIPNIFGLILFLFACVGTFILVRPEYKREENRSQGLEMQ